MVENGLFANPSGLSARAWSADLDGVLAFQGRAPRFDGALTLAVPAGLKVKGSANGDVPITPWRMAIMVTGPIGAAAANPIKNAAESTWMYGMNTMLREIGRIGEGLPTTRPKSLRLLSTVATVLRGNSVDVSCRRA